MSAMAMPSIPARTAIVLIAYVSTLAVLVACAFLWVFIYSTFIDSSGDAAYYEAYAQRASPVVAVVLSAPVFYLMGNFMRRFGSAAMGLALTVVAINLVIDVAVLMTFATDLSHHVAMSALAALAKLTGAWFGVRTGAT